jgi:hypothetical protein
VSKAELAARADVPPQMRNRKALHRRALQTLAVKAVEEEQDAALGFFLDVADKLGKGLPTRLLSTS